MMILLKIIVVFIASSVSSTNFPQKYGIPRLPYRRHAGIPRGVQVGILGTGPIQHVSPLLPPIHTKVTWVKKYDPRTGNWVKVMHRKPLPMSIISREHFARKAHIARKMHNIAKANSMARLNAVRGGMLRASSQPFQRRNIGRHLVQQDSRRLYKTFGRQPRRSIQLNRRTGVAHAFAPRLHTTPVMTQRVNSLHRPGRFNGEFYEQIDNTFDDRFDNGFGSVGTGEVSSQNSVRTPFVQNNIPRVAPRGFTSSVNIVPHRRGDHARPMVPPSAVNLGTGGVGGLTRIGLPYPEDQLKPGANGEILSSFDRKTTSFDSHPSPNVGVLSTQQTLTSATNSRFMSNRPLAPLPTFPVVSVGLAPVIRDNRDFGEVSTDDADDKFEVLHDRIEEELDAVNDHLEFLNNRLDLNDMLDSVDEQNDHISEQLNDGFNDDQTIVGGIAGEIGDGISDIHPLRGIGGDGFADTDDGIERTEESPIHGLELLGPSTWQDVLTELQSVGAYDDTLQRSGEGIQVLPINPHSSEDTYPAKHDNDMLMDTNTDFNSVGTLALLGIDPSSIRASESVVGETPDAPDHPPPILLPSGELSAHKQDPLDTQTTRSKTAIKTNDTKIVKDAGLPTFEQDFQRTLNDAVDTLNTIATINALKEFVSIS